MKRRILFTLGAFFALLCLLTGRAELSYADKEEISSVQIAFAADLHYISPKLTDKGPLFQYVAERNDGKLILYTEEILDAFIAQMLEERPEVVILAGDLSYNGEFESHLSLAEKLRRLQAEGIQVLVLSGNHDVDNPRAYSFHGESYEKARPTTPQDFSEIYYEFGPAQAISIDPASGSYVFQLEDMLRILMLDTNSVSKNSLPSESFSWLEEQLRDAQNQNIHVIAVSHQNLKIHHPLFIRGYRITNASSIEKLYRQYKVICQLSGHMHIQHAVAGTVPEILTSPLCLTPVRYGWLVWNGESLCYDARETDVARFAAEKGETDENLLHFPEYARNNLYQIHYNQIVRSYEGSGLEKKTVEKFAALFADTNYAFFTGEPIDHAALEEGLRSWKEADPGFHSSYLESILEDNGRDPLHYLIR